MSLCPFLPINQMCIAHNRCQCSSIGMWSTIKYAWLLKSLNFAKIVILPFGYWGSGFCDWRHTYVFKKYNFCVSKQIQCCLNTVNYKKHFHSWQSENVIYLIWDVASLLPWFVTHVYSVVHVFIFSYFYST